MPLHSFTFESGFAKCGVERNRRNSEHRNGNLFLYFFILLLKTKETGMNFIQIHMNVYETHTNKHGNI